MLGIPQWKTDRGLIGKNWCSRGLPPLIRDLSHCTGLGYAQEEKQRITGIQWWLTRCLEDLDFADDQGLLAHKHLLKQIKVNQLTANAEMTGLRVIVDKI